MKPLIVFVDDEPHNLTVFEAALPPEWEVITFDNPLKALDQLTTLQPALVVTDQRMPGMKGVNFLEIIKKTHPLAKRVLVTGYSEEDLIVDSIRKAGVHDYIRKPWDVDDLVHRLSQMISTYHLESELLEQKNKLEKQNLELRVLTAELKQAKVEEETLRKELESWAPPFLLETLKNKDHDLSLKRDIAALTFDIVESSKYHDVKVDGRPIRSIVLQGFSEAVLRNGGWRESHSGDSAYAHFGILTHEKKPSESALAAASEFRVFLRSIATKYDIPIECGVGLHVAQDITINIHQVEINTPHGIIIQKSFDTSSSDVDLVHRIEKFIHILPGSNVAMSEQFVKSLASPPPGLVDLGYHKLKGQKDLIRIYLKPSDKAQTELIEHLKEQAVTAPLPKAA
jgi:CheY-like chemotaxis protein/class 3 adenylate cyclase